MDEQQILNLPQGADAPFNQVLLRAPGVAEDSAANGDLHVRGEHGNLQYRINDVLLPEGITGFGLELDPRFVGSMQLITGSLPAQYGFRTAGIVDIQTKSGALDQGGEASLYGGSFDTVRPSFELGGSQGKLSYFADASYDHNGLGIENPTASRHADPRRHGPVQGVRVPLLASWTPRAAASASWAAPRTATSRCPTRRGLPAGTSPDGTPWVPGDVRLGRPQREAERAELLRRRHLPEVRRRPELPGLRASAATAACISRPTPSATSTSTAWRATSNGRSIPPACRATAATRSRDRHTLRAGFTFLDEACHGRLDDDGVPRRRGRQPDRARASPSRTTRRSTASSRRLPPGRVEASRRADAQFRGALRRVRLVVRRRGPAQPPRQPHLPARDSDDAARGLRALFHAAAGGECLRAHGRAVRGHLEPVRHDAGRPGEGREVRLLRRRHHARRSPPASRSASTATTSARGTSSTTACSARRSSSPRSTMPRARSTASSCRLLLRGRLHHLPEPRPLRGEGRGLELGAVPVRPRRPGLREEPLGSSSTTTRRCPAPSAPPTTGSHARAPRASTWTRSTAPACARTPGARRLEHPERRHRARLLHGQRRRRADLPDRRRRTWKVRLDIVNITDNSYELRDGTGVGVNAAQYGMRRGFFGSAAYSF